jgi:mRNA-degrading endonuclease RelE of RelBE toxin-antitoxin system
VLKKIDEILHSEDLDHYKNLKHDLKEKKRVHVGHFVLVFKWVKEENKVIFLDFDHHDNIYEE